MGRVVLPNPNFFLVKPISPTSQFNRFYGLLYPNYSGELSRSLIELELELNGMQVWLQVEL